jgi:hypothetical protein
VKRVFIALGLAFVLPVLLYLGAYYVIALNIGLAYWFIASLIVSGIYLARSGPGPART